MNEALAERIAAGGGIKEESDPVFKNWKDESHSIGIGKGTGSVANGVAIGWNSSAGAGTGTGSNDAGAALAYADALPIVRKLFGDGADGKGDIFSFKPRTLYAFVINNAERLKADFREAIAVGAGRADAGRRVEKQVPHPTRMDVHVRWREAGAGRKREKRIQGVSRVR